MMSAEDAIARTDNMKKTYITTMPDHIGAFLQASKCFAELGINITRVSYNKAVDAHTLFIDAEGSTEKLKEADARLTEIGYINRHEKDANIILLEFLLEDIPGSVTKILEIINEFNFNISYISSQESGGDYQNFKMGLFVEDITKVSAFIEKTEKICAVKVIEYNQTEKIMDNSIFYTTFVSNLARSVPLTSELKNELLVNTNLAMQTLDETGLSPYKTFDSIGKFAELLTVCKGQAFSPRISNHVITDNTEIILIEPPCGSNTAIIRHKDDYLFIDSGYACYKEEMTAVFNSLIPDFDNINKRILITHADVDHCGLLDMFDEVIASAKSKECLALEFDGKDGFREQNHLHKPYIRICKALTSYKLTDPDKIITPWSDYKNQESVIKYIGDFTFGDLEFEVYEGNGGHLKGEVILIDYAHKLVFTGDVYVNTHGMTSEQKLYNSYAPILMTSVDTDPELCAMERKAVMNRLGVGDWKIFGAHGMCKDLQISSN